MSNKPLVRCSVRLLALAIMVGMLGFLFTTTKVAAGTLEECEQAFAFCLYENCRGLSGPGYEACRDGCDLTYESCRLDNNYQPPPAPFPVEDHSRETCMLATNACGELEDYPDALTCFMEIRAYCIATYPKP